MEVTYVILRYIRYITPFNMQNDLERNNIKDRDLYN